MLGRSNGEEYKNKQRGQNRDINIHREKGRKNKQEGYSDAIYKN